MKQSILALVLMTAPAIAQGTAEERGRGVARVADACVGEYLFRSGIAASVKAGQMSMTSSCQCAAERFTLTAAPGMLSKGLDAAVRLEVFQAGLKACVASR